MEREREEGEVQEYGILMQRSLKQLILILECCKTQWRKAIRKENSLLQVSTFSHMIVMWLLFRTDFKTMWRVQCLEELRSGAAAIVFREAYALRHYIISPVRDTSPLIPPIFFLPPSLPPRLSLGLSFQTSPFLWLSCSVYLYHLQLE